MNVQRQRMTCLRCGHVWTDLPGVLGKHYKDGCPECASLYWRAEDVEGAL